MNELSYIHVYCAITKVNVIKLIRKGVYRDCIKRTRDKTTVNLMMYQSLSAVTK